MGSLGGWEILIILGVLVLLFGAKRLPDMARSVGQSARVFKGEMKGLREDEKGTDRSTDKGAEKGADKAPRADVRTDGAEEVRPVSRPETPGSTTA